MCMIETNLICEYFFPYLKLFKLTSIDSGFMFHLYFSCVTFVLWIILLVMSQLNSASKQILNFKHDKQMTSSDFFC